MSLPLLTALRERHPKAHITWICGKQVRSLLEATGLIDQILEIDEKRLLKGNLWIKMMSLLQIWLRLVGRKFDLALTLHPDARYRLISWPIRCKDRRYWGRNRFRFYPVPGRYHAQEYVNLLEKERGPLVQSCKFPPLQRQKVQKSFDIIIAPGGAKNVLAEDDGLRRWPMEHYAELVKKLNAHSFQIAITGSQGDAWILPYLEGLEFANCIGQFDLLGLIGLLQHCKLLITHDSGPLHLAKLAGCRALALFGPTNPWEKVSLEERVRVLWGGERLACRPCYNGKTYASCLENRCLAEILPQTVYLEALSLLT